MTRSHLLKLVLVLSLAGAIAACAADPATNVPAAINTAVDAQAAMAREMKEAKKKARQAEKEAKAAQRKAEAEAKAAKKKADEEAKKAQREAAAAKKKAEQEAKKAEKEARKKAAAEAKAAATNAPPAVAEATGPATNVEAPVQTPVESAKPAETNVVPAAVPPAPSMRAKMYNLWKEAEYRFLIGADYILPTDSETWKSTYGFNAEVRKWFGEEYGMSFVAGFSSWDVNGDADVLGNKDAVNPGTISGSADLMAFGIGGLYRHPFSTQYQLILDAGLKYVMADSAIKIRFNYRGHFSDVHVTSPVDPGDRVTGWIGASLAGSMEEDARVSVLLGIGYQFDVIRPSENWLYEDVANNLDALVVRLSVGF